MLVTSLVFQSCIRPYVDSTVSLVVPPAIQSSTTFLRPLLRLALTKGKQSGTGITATTVAVHKRNIKMKKKLMPVGLLFVHFIFLKLRFGSSLVHSHKGWSWSCGGGFFYNKNLKRAKSFLYFRISHFLIFKIFYFIPYAFQKEL